MNGQEAVVRLLLEKGDDLKAKTNGKTPLSRAIWNRRKAMASLLGEKGAYLEAKNKDGNTPLSLAAHEGHEAVTRLLLEEGANLRTKNKDGDTPRQCAERNGHKAVARLLGRGRR